MSELNDMDALPTGGQPIAPAAEVEAAPEAPATPEGEATPEAKPPTPSIDDDVKKSLRGVQKRIGEFAEQARVAEERGRQQAEYWRSEAFKAQQALEAQKQATQAPRFEQFSGNMDEYTAAVARHEAQKIANERVNAERQFYFEQQQQVAAQDQQRQAEAHYQRMVESKIAEAVKKYPDFAEVVSSPELPPIRNSPAFSAILDSEKGAEIMYFLGKNPLRAHQIIGLSPVGQVREIGRIEASLAAGSSVSSAPPPVDTVGATRGAGPKDPSKMSYKEFVEWRHRSKAQKR